MLFIEDILLVAETTLEGSSGRKKVAISRAKMKYLRCNFSGEEQQGEPQVTVGKDVVAQTTNSKYLGSLIQSNKETNKYVTHQMQVGWLKWRASIGVLCDRSFSTRLKGEFY